jgi:hypothetical protein
MYQKVGTQFQLISSTLSMFAKQNEEKWSEGQRTKKVDEINELFYDKLKNNQE